jgi:hypothetical protein
MRESQFIPFRSLGLPRSPMIEPTGLARRHGARSSESAVPRNRPAATPTELSAGQAR